MQDEYAVISIRDLIKDDTFKYRANLNVDELVDSIRQDGQLIPIVVRPFNSKYQLISGFRRIAAMTKLGRKKVQAKVMNSLSDIQARKISLLEKIERNSLSS